METVSTDEYLALSGIQHFSFCPRQWALIHVEQQWKENILTFNGQELHRKTNDPFVVEKRKDRIVARAVPIVSHTLRLYGVADVIEFEKAENGVTLDGRNGLWWPQPVEYKVGKPKLDNWDMVQVCAQAICLEEMYGVRLKMAQIFYGKTRRRLDVPINRDLRDETMEVAKKMHEIFDAGITPKAIYRPACEKCSLADLCAPKLSERKNIEDYFLEILQE